MLIGCSLVATANQHLAQNVSTMVSTLSQKRKFFSAVQSGPEITRPLDFLFEFCIFDGPMAGSAQFGGRNIWGANISKDR